MDNSFDATKEIVENLSSYKPPVLKELTLKDTIVNNRVRLYEIKYEKTIFNTTYTHQEVALIFGEPPADLSSTPIYFDLVEMHLPLSRHFKYVDYSQVNSAPGTSARVGLSNALRSLNASTDIRVACCVNFRESAETEPLHPCDEPLSTIGLEGGGKSICTQSISYEISGPQNAPVAVPLIFFLEKKEFLENDNNNTLTEVGEKLAEHYKLSGGADYLFGNNFDGMFVFPTLWPSGGILYYMFPNREGDFGWPMSINVGDTRDVAEWATVRFSRWETAIEGTTRQKPKVLGIDHPEVILPMEEWSNIATIHTLLDPA
ncbi:MAG: hypothetical protein AAFZ63_19875 [Bacteroidota bacterium]